MVRLPGMLHIVYVGIKIKMNVSVIYSQKSKTCNGHFDHYLKISIYGIAVIEIGKPLFY